MGRLSAQDWAAGAAQAARELREQGDERSAQRVEELGRETARAAEEQR